MGVHGGGKTGDRGDEQHALGAEVDDAGSLVDEEAEARERHGGARVDARAEQQRHRVHHQRSLPGATGLGDDQRKR